MSRRNPGRSLNLGPLAGALNVGIGIVLMVAALSKFGDLAAFHANLSRMNLSASLVSLVVLVLPGLEFVLAALFLFRIHVRETFWIVTPMILSFIGFHIWIAVSYPGKTCNCIQLNFFHDSAVIGNWSLVFLALASGIVYFHEFEERCDVTLAR